MVLHVYLLLSPIYSVIQTSLGVCSQYLSARYCKRKCYLFIGRESKIDCISHQHFKVVLDLTIL